MSSKLKACFGPDPGMAKLDLSNYPHLVDSELFRILKHLPSMDSGGPWIAGGSLWRTLNKEPLINCDIDVFFRNKEQFEAISRKIRSLPFVNNILRETRKKWNTIYKYHVNEGNTFNKTVDIQFINMAHYSSLAKLLSSFDFTVCQFGWDGKNLLAGSTSLEDLDKKQLVFYKITKPKSLIRHLHKYLSNGFTISSKETKCLAYQLIEMDCWAKTEGGQYEDEDCSKNEKMKMPYVEEDAPWEGGGYVAGLRSPDEAHQLGVRSRRRNGANRDIREQPVNIGENNLTTDRPIVHCRVGEMPADNQWAIPQTNASTVWYHGQNDWQPLGADGHPIPNWQPLGADDPHPYRAVQVQGVDVNEGAGWIAGPAPAPADHPFDPLQFELMRLNQLAQEAVVNANDGIGQIEQDGQPMANRPDNDVRHVENADHLIQQVMPEPVEERRIGVNAQRIIDQIVQERNNDFVHVGQDGHIGIGQLPPMANRPDNDVVDHLIRQGMPEPANNFDVDMVIRDAHIVQHERENHLAEQHYIQDQDIRERNAAERQNREWAVAIAAGAVGGDFDINAMREPDVRNDVANVMFGYAARNDNPVRIEPDEPEIARDLFREEVF